MGFFTIWIKDHFDQDKLLDGISFGFNVRTTAVLLDPVLTEVPPNDILVICRVEVRENGFKTFVSFDHCLAFNEDDYKGFVAKRIANHLCTTTLVVDYEYPDPYNPYRFVKILLTGETNHVGIDPMLLDEKDEYHIVEDPVSFEEI